MEDFGLRPVGPADWYSRKSAIDPRKRQRQPDQQDAGEEPMDSVELSSDEEAATPGEPG
jgi:hypothetical protein